MGIIRQNIKFGIVGCGRIANERHIPDLLKIKGVDVCAVCDTSENRAIETSQRFNIPHYFTNFESMLEKSDVDVIDICTPPKTHLMLGLKAIRAGCHVLLEKPMALHVRECDELISNANKVGVKLSVVHQLLFNPVVQKAKRLVDEGKIGKLVDVDVKVLARKDICVLEEGSWAYDLPGGVFGELAPHPIYLCQAFLNEIRSVKVVPLRIQNHPRMAFDELKVLLESGSAVGSISVSVNSPFTLTGVMDIRGTEKTLYADPQAQTLVIHSARKPGPFGYAKSQIESLFHRLNGLLFVSSRYLTRSLKGGHYFLLQRFVNSIQRDEEVPVTGEEGKETVRILEEIWNQVDEYRVSKANS